MQYTTHRREDHLDGRRHSCDGHRDGRRRRSDDNDVTMCRDDLRRGCGGGGGSKKRNCSFSASSSTVMANNRIIVNNRRRSRSEHHRMDPPIISHAPLDPPASDSDKYSKAAVSSGSWKKSIYTPTLLAGSSNSNATGASLKGKSVEMSSSTKSSAGASSPVNDGGITVSGTWKKSIYTPTLLAYPSSGTVRPVIENSKAASTTASSSSSSSSSSTPSFCGHSTTTTESIIRRRRRASWDGRSKYYNRKKIVSFSEDRLMERGRERRLPSTKFDTRRALVVVPKKTEQTPSNNRTLTHKSKMDNDIIKFISFLTKKLLLPCMMLPVIIIRASTCEKKKDNDRMPPSLDTSSCGSDDDVDDDSWTMKRRGTGTTYCSDESSSSSSYDDDSSGGDGRLITSYYHYSSTTIDDDGAEELERCKRDKKDYRDLVIRKRHGVVLVGREKKDDEDVRSYYRDCIDELVHENESLCKYTLFCALTSSSFRNYLYLSSYRA